MAAVEKYIYYRDDFKDYIVSIKIKDELTKKRRAISKVAKSIEEARMIKSQMMELYNLDVKLLKRVMKKNHDDETSKALNSNISDLITEWYNNVCKKNLKPETQKSYEFVLNKYFINMFYSAKLKDIDNSLLRMYVNKLLENNISQHCIGIMQALITRFFKYYVNKGVLAVNPFNGIKFKKSKSKRRMSFTKDEKNTFLNYVRKYNEKLYFMYNLYFETMCRRGELLAITWNDILWNERSIYINKTLININYIVSTQYSTKNDVNRYVYFSLQSYEYLKAMYKNDMRNGFSKDSYIFRNTNEQPYRPTQVSSVFKQYVLRSGVNEDLCLHSCRHTTATELLSKNVPINVVQKLGGWLSSKTLLNVYAHATMSEDNKHKIINVISPRDSSINKNKLMLKISDQSKIKRVRCITTNELFSTCVEAAKRYNISACSIQRCCRNEKKHTIRNGVKEWEYVYK